MLGRANGGRWILRLDPGEMIIRALTAFCTNLKISGATFSGIGTCRNPELGFFDVADKAYRFRTLAGDYEIASLSGNVTLLEDKPFVHAHAVLGDSDFVAWAGHFREGEVLVTCEIAVEPLAESLVRLEDPETGLKLWS
jgi:hypothetical protein